MMNDTRACRETPKIDLGNDTNETTYPMVPAGKCFSATTANDWDYVRKVVSFVTNSSECREGAGTESGKNWCGDAARIYFTGQSMGGMSSIQFSVREGKYAQKERPAAIVSCSAGGARNNDATLDGKVPTLLMQGGRDNVAVPTVFAGFNRHLETLHGSPYYYSYYTSETYKILKKDKSLLTKALEILNMSAPLLSKPNYPSQKLAQPQQVLLDADAMWGGALLENYAEALENQSVVGCRENGSLTGIGEDGYIWQTISTTLRNVVGRSVVMKDFEYFKPVSDSVNDAAVDLATIRCAYVPGHGPGTPAKVKFCAFDGFHTWPWNDYNSGKWYPGTDNGRVFHNFVWVDFLENGSLRRSSI